MSEGLHYLELLELSQRLQRRDVTSVEATSAQLERIARLDSGLFSYVTVHSDEALSCALAADAEIAAGKYRGPLHGIPIALKDLFIPGD